VDCSIYGCNIKFLYSVPYVRSVIYLLTHSLPPCCRVLEKLTGSQLVKKYPAFYGARWFITAFTIARLLSLSLARSIHSMPPFPLLEDPSSYYRPFYASVFQVRTYCYQKFPPPFCPLLFRFSTRFIILLSCSRLTSYRNFLKL